MGIEQLKTELTKELATLAGLKAQRDILNASYLDALAYSERYVARSGGSAGRLDQLKQTRVEVKAQYETILKDIISRQSYFAPILRCPTELIMEIFELCWGNGEVPLASLKDALSLLRLPWHLSATCRVWRKVSIGTSCLWSNIMLSFGALETPPCVIKLWVQRCGASAASLYWLSNSDAFRSGNVQNLRFALKRVRALNVCTLQQSVMEQRMSIDQRRSHKLAIASFQKGIELLLRGHRRNLFKGIEEIRWVAPQFSWTSSPLLAIIQHAPAQTITHFTFGLKEDPRLLQILSDMPLLREARIFLPHHYRIVRPEVPISLPSLQHLYVAACTFKFVSGFLCRLNTPSLRALDISLGANDSQEFPPQGLVQFLDTSPSHLKHLGIQDLSEPMFPCLTSGLHSLLASARFKSSLTSFYIRGHPRIFGELDEITTLLGEMPNMAAYFVGNTEASATFGHSLISQMNWAHDILCDKMLIAYLTHAEASTLHS